MTRRVERMSPAEFAARFVDAGQRVINRVAAGYPELDRRSALLRLTEIIGGGWTLSAETADGCELLASGTDAELGMAGRVLARSAISELHESDRGRLLSRMHSHEDMPGEEPAHFRVVLALSGLTWTLRVAAHAHCSSAVVAEVAGTLADDVKVAA